MERRGSLNGLIWQKPAFGAADYGDADRRRATGASARLLEMAMTAPARCVSVERSRLMLMLVAVSLTAAATALLVRISFIFVSCRAAHRLPS